MVRPAGVRTPAPDAERPRPASEHCLACGAPLETDQEWCLECGAARTSLTPPPDWRIALVIVLAVVALVVVVLLIALP
jgi:RNA polymerase subunit RPABC4/transcription elongation factor Spt4